MVESFDKSFISGRPPWRVPREYERVLDYIREELSESNSSTRGAKFEFVSLSRPRVSEVGWDSEGISPALSILIRNASALGNLDPLAFKESSRIAPLTFLGRYWEAVGGAKNARAMQLAAVEARDSSPEGALRIARAHMKLARRMMKSDLNATPAYRAVRAIHLVEAAVMLRKKSVSLDGAQARMKMFQGALDCTYRGIASINWIERDEKEKPTRVFPELKEAGLDVVRGWAGSLGIDLRTMISVEEFMIGGGRPSELTAVPKPEIGGGGAGGDACCITSAPPMPNAVLFSASVMAASALTVVSSRFVV